LYSVLVDCLVYRRTCCHCGSRRSSVDWPLCQFSTGFTVLRCSRN
jgi:hypothetical protein